MYSDIILDLAVEKIRLDFGDLPSTIFQILIIQSGCSIYEINKIIPHIGYNILRGVLYKLFSHNIIFFKKNNQDSDIHILKLKDIKIYASIHTSINRLRFPRYLSIIEKEYGNITRKIIKKFMDYGQINSSKIIKILCKNTFKNCKQTEDSIIGIARDQIIEKLISPGLYLSKKKIFEENLKLNVNILYKPISYSNSDYLWKISYLKLTTLIKTDIIISISEEYFCEKFKIFIRCCLSKNFGNNLNFVQLDWFSLDSVKDYGEEITCIDVYDELFVIQLVENFSINQFILQIKKSSFKFRTEYIIENLQKKLLENFINNQFGQRFFRVFKTLSLKSEFNENKIAEECILDKKLIRKFLYQMYRMNFIFLEEKNKYVNMSSHRNLISWKLNLKILFDRYLFEIYKGLYNLILKIEDLKLIIKKNRNRNYYQNSLKKNQLYQLNILIVCMIRLDGILIILEK